MLSELYGMGILSSLSLANMREIRAREKHEILEAAARHLSNKNNIPMQRERFHLCAFVMIISKASCSVLEKSWQLVNCNLSFRSRSPIRFARFDTQEMLLLCVMSHFEKLSDT